MRRSALLLLGALALAGSAQAADAPSMFRSDDAGGDDDRGPIRPSDREDDDPSPPRPAAGSRWIVGTYEAEAATLGGGARIVGAADGSDRQVGDLAGEASGRRAVTLTSVGDSVSFTTLPAHAGANAIVVRYSIPDAPDGGGQTGTLNLSIADATGAPVLNATLKLTSRYAWLYGGIRDGVRLYNVPDNARQFGLPREPIGPIHLYDEIQLKLKKRLRPGYSVKLTKAANDPAGPVTIDFIELEVVPPPLPQPPGYLSLAQCGAIALDTNGTGEAFDGADDSSYGSVFHPVIGINPFNLTAPTQEKDTYSTDPLHDRLQDTLPNAIAGGLKMFDLADHNFQSLQTCIGLVAGSGGAYRGVFIPAGRYYARGFLPLPDHISIRGAGMWYSKFAAVDTAPPAAMTFNGVTGIASKDSGNLVFSGGPNGSDSVSLSDFSMFGNVTQRDSPETRPPYGVTATFSNSRFDGLWIEHYVVGVSIRGNATRNLATNSRARNTLAGGIVQLGSPTGSLVRNCHARSNGDDGFAIWSSSTDPTQLATDNAIVDSLAQLQWIANGFADYGGAHNVLDSDQASDTLQSSCVQISTNFVPAGLPAATSMSARASDLSLTRCGGNPFNQPIGALLVGVQTESLDEITLSHIKIVDPLNSGIDLQQFGFGTGRAFSGSLSNVTFDHVRVYAPPVCAAVGAFMQGSARFDDVCSCDTHQAASACNVANASATTFQVNPNTCSQKLCRKPLARRDDGPDADAGDRDAP